MQNNLRRSTALKKLKPCDFMDEAKNLAMDNVIARKEEVGEVDLKDLEY